MNKLSELRDSVLQISYEIDSIKNIITRLEIAKDNLIEEKVKLLKQIDSLIKVVEEENNG